MFVLEEKRVTRNELCICAVLLIIILEGCNSSGMIDEYHNSSKVETVFLNEDLDAERLAANRENRAYDSYEYYFRNIYTDKTDLVFCGDSISFRVQWNEIFPDKITKNRGIPGDSSSGLLARIDSIIQTNPQKVFILIGINDICNEVRVEVFLDNYRRILEKLQSELPNSKIYVQSILPVKADEKQWNKDVVFFNSELMEICKKSNVTYIDLWNHFANSDGELREEYSYDGIHLSSIGYKCWKEILNKYVY